MFACVCVWKCIDRVFVQAIRHRVLNHVGKDSHYIGPGNERHTSLEPICASAHAPCLRLLAEPSAIQSETIVALCWCMLSACEKRTHVALQLCDPSLGTRWLCDFAKKAAQFRSGTRSVCSVCKFDVHNDGCSAVRVRLLMHAGCESWPISRRVTQVRRGGQYRNCSKAFLRAISSVLSAARASSRVLC